MSTFQMGDQSERQSRTLFARNISFQANENDFRAIQAFSNAVEIKIPVDKETGRPRGFGFIEYGTVEECKAALESLQAQGPLEFHGRECYVNQSVPTNKGGPRARGGGMGGGLQSNRPPWAQQPRGPPQHFQSRGNGFGNGGGYGGNYQQQQNGGGMNGQQFGGQFQQSYSQPQQSYQGHHPGGYGDAPSYQPPPQNGYGQPQNGYQTNGQFQQGAVQQQQQAATAQINPYGSYAQ